jgi:hypothetical protein
VSTQNTNFTAANNAILDPNGNSFIAKGIGLEDDQLSGNTASQILSDFPGINMVRLGIRDFNGQLSADAQTLVQQLTSQGVVVELEDHHTDGSNSNNVLTGSSLTQEAQAYASLAQQYASNPYVWFGTMNEPDSPTQGAVSAQEQAIYQAIRDAGNNSPIMLEEGGGADSNVLTPADYSNMTNVIWDAHVYGWESQYNPDQTSVTNALNSQVQAVQAIPTGEGTAPVILGEWGIATDGHNLDANWQQIINAVTSSGLGSLAWNFGPNDPGDPNQLTTDGTSLTNYGQQVAAFIKTNSGSGTPAGGSGSGGGSSSSGTPGSGSPGTPGSGSPGPAPTPASPDNTVVVGTNGSIVDGSGNTWAINSSGVITENGQTDTRTGNVTELAYENGTVWQENNQNLWWSYDGSSNTWGPDGGTSTSPLPSGGTPFIGGTFGSGSDALVLNISEDAWADGGSNADGAGDANFTVAVDGNQIGGVLTANASHAAGQTEAFTFQGNFGAGTHNVAVDFINDAWGGTANTDRNLYVDSVTYNGVNTNQSASLYSNGPQMFYVTNS